MDARALLVGLIERRCHVDRAADARTERARIGLRQAGVLHDELRAGRDGIGEVVKNRSALVAGGRSGGVRAVALIVVRVRERGIVAVRRAGELLELPCNPCHAV